MRKGDRLLVWKLDRLGRNLLHLINTVHDLTTRGIGFQVLTGHGASINTATPEGKLVFGIFAVLAEFERELVSERTKVGLAAARARGSKGGGRYKMTSAKLHLAMAVLVALSDGAILAAPGGATVPLVDGSQWSQREGTQERQLVRENKWIRRRALVNRCAAGAGKTG